MRIQATDNLFRSVGIEGENDARAWAIGRAVLGNFRGVDPETVDRGEIDVAVMGISLGLMLAEATGWDPPLGCAPPEG